MPAYGLALVLCLVRTARAGEPGALDLPAAVALARASSPNLQAAQRRVAEARSELTSASMLLRDNPEVELGLGPRLLDPGVTGERLALEAGVSQQLEIGGQRGHRIDRARAEIAAAEAEALGTGRSLDLAVATGFFQALGAAERARIAGEHEALARDLLEIGRARLERGAAAPIEVNGAVIRLAEATRQRARSEAEARAARTRLAPLLGVDPARLQVLTGEIPPPSPSMPAPASDPVEQRPEVVAAAARTRSARAAAALAGASAWPDVRLGVRYATEEASRAIVGQLAFALPLFNRNQGERERARAVASRADAEERGVRAQATADVAEARIEWERARSVLSMFDGAVLRALEENLTLLRRMLAAGKVAPAEVILLERELLEGRLGHTEARVDAAVAEARLLALAGLPITHGADGDRR